MSRNVYTSNWNSDHNNFNMVQVGVEGAPADHCGNSNGNFGSTSASKTPVSAEKPYVAQDFTDNSKYNLVVPQAEWGTSGQSYHSSETVIPFTDVYVADNSTDTASTINQKLLAGLNIVFQPGVYTFDATINVNTNNQVLLGLGLATLQNTVGQPVITVGNNEGVRIAGLLIQAGISSSGSNSVSLI